jgi:hypothetical protein
MLASEYVNSVIQLQLGKATPLIGLKCDLCDTFHKYFAFPKFQFLMFGPQHGARAAAVLKVIVNCDDLETIKDILNHQIKIMKGIDFIATTHDIEKFMALGLDKRYVMDNGLNNKPKDLNTSKYFKTLTESLRLVEEAKAQANAIKPPVSSMS